MKTKTKLLALFLTLAMLVSVVAVIPAVAETTNYYSVDAANAEDGVGGQYATLGAAVAAVKDGGTIKLIGDITYTGRDTANPGIESAKTYTVDGKKADGSGNYKITDSNKQQDIFKFSGSSHVTMTNIDFVVTGSSGNDSIWFIADGKTDTLTLGSGVTVTGTAAMTYGAVMMGGGSLIIDGAVFNLNGAVAFPWGDNHAVSVTLNSGVFSTKGNGIIVKGYGSATANVTLNSKTVKVNDYANNQTGDNARALYTSDITAPGTISYGTGLSQADFTKPAEPSDAYVSVNAGATKYNTLAEAVAAAQNNDVLTVHGELNVTSATLINGKTLTLKGEDAAVIKGNTAILTLHNANVTIENLTLQCNTSDNYGVVTLGNDQDSDNNYTGSALTLNSGAKLINTASAGGNTGGNGVAAKVESDNNRVTVNAGAEITTGGTTFWADKISMQVTIAGGTVTSSNRGMVVNNNGTVGTKSSLTVTGGVLKTTNPSQWLVNIYSCPSFALTISGGEVSTGGSSVLESGKKNNYTIELTGGTIKQGATVLFQASDLQSGVTFSDNYMYLYIPTEGATKYTSGLGFATKVTTTGSGNWTYGMLVLPQKIMTAKEVDTLTKDTEEVLKIKADSLNENGYIKAALTTVTSNLGVVCARAYASVTVTLGTNATWEATYYGELMGADGSDFARAYERDHETLSAEEQEIVNHFKAFSAT